MAVISVHHHHHHPSSYPADPLLPWLRSIKEGLDGVNADPNSTSRGGLEKLLSECIRTFKNNSQYQNDERFLKIWFLYMDCTGDFENVYKEMEESKICFMSSLLYETCALFLEAKGRLVDAFRVFKSAFREMLRRLRG
ncbi:hypothetical protein Nepgr_013944 [Nepenthes gracilis]|uniref:BUB1 N-terminal domain-containing protein n=1 Tax=Nepenthes gracilis TaxID=150966 RepID=A0AAD3XPE8_NEPGR|nr:hypothetical protein Nepgr_013944 [Nepenthes gracilis]